MCGAETWRYGEANTERLNALKMDAQRIPCTISRMNVVPNERIRELVGNKDVINDKIRRKQLLR